jgi:hypothetical protein
MDHDLRKFQLPVEIVVVLVIVVFIIWFITPEDCFRLSKPKDRVAETKANIHTIQVSIERYYTDNGEYPPYLLGGDIDCWESWHAQWDGVNDIQIGAGRIASNEKLVDPLIEGGYITYYPSNVFISDGRENIRATSINGRNYGEGDPRFGFKGNEMAMCLDDPNYFGGTLQPNPEQWSEIETRRTLDHGDYMNVPEIFKNSGSGMYYTFGGLRNTSGEGEPYTLNHWPGNFFYRSIPGDMTGVDFLTPLYESPQHYILGGFGKSDNEGMDVFRLETTDPDGNRIKWRFQEPTSDDPYYFGSQFSDDENISGYGYPAVFGGGDAWTGPIWPFIDNESGEVLYGAPDGVPDGVIIVLTDGSEMEKFVD